MTRRPDSEPVTLAVCGDPVVGRALVLLLRGSGYDARFLPASSLSEPESLESVRLLLLTSMSEPKAERHKALLASLKDAPEAAEMPVLELVTTSRETRAAEAWDSSGHAVPWPCTTEELERRIEAVLLADPGADLAARQSPRTR